MHQLIFTATIICTVEDREELVIEYGDGADHTDDVAVVQALKKALTTGLDIAGVVTELTILNCET